MAPKQKKERAAGTSTRAPRLDPELVISVKVDKNPKREGSASYARFENYKSGMTIKQAREAGLTAADIAYDLKHDYISVRQA